MTQSNVEFRQIKSFLSFFSQLNQQKQNIRIMKIQSNEKAVPGNCTAYKP
jgi:hypothetical protein